MTWLGTITGMIGAVLLAANLGIGVVVAGYVAFLISSVVWSAVALRRRDVPLLWMQSFFVVVNAAGIVRWAT